VVELCLAHGNKVMRQVKEHKDAVLDLIDRYLTGLTASHQFRADDTCSAFVPVDTDALIYELMRDPLSAITRY